MSEHRIDPRAELTAPDNDTAELPMIVSPPLSPALALLAAIEIEPDPPAAPENVPEIKPDTPAEPAAAEPNATQRFRAAAAAQVAAARERLAKRNISSIMALALIACVAGGFGTVLASNAIAQFSAPDPRIAQMASMSDAIARLEDDIAALRGRVERTAELTAAHDGQTDERIAQIEKAQAEPAAKLAKLGEAIDRLRSAHAQLMAQAGEITGSIKPSATGGAKKQGIVEGWTLKEVDRDAALIEGKRGLFETYVGDTIPGVGRVEAFRKQEGRWVVVTAKGLIVSK